MNREEIYEAIDKLAEDSNLSSKALEILKKSGVAADTFRRVLKWFPNEYPRVVELATNTPFDFDQILIHAGYFNPQDPIKGREREVYVLDMLTEYYKANNFLAS